MKEKIKSTFLLILFSFCFFSFSFAKENRYDFKSMDKDPFRPLISKNGTVLISRKVSLGGLIIKGIIYSKDSPVAIINDLVLRKGESIGEYTVVEIKRRKVILKNADEEFILNLEEEE